MTECQECGREWEPPCEHTACIDLYGECMVCRYVAKTWDDERFKDEWKAIDAALGRNQTDEKGRPMTYWGGDPLPKESL